jgi:divalent metal cation (Fe/Co/Zn/Cd) transporter
MVLQMKKNLLSRENRVERWILFANISVYGNIVLAAGKLAMGIYSGSYFLGIAAMYNIGMALAKRTALKAYKTGGQPYFAVGAIIAVSGIVFMVYCLRYFFFGNPMQYTELAAIHIAAITFAEIGFASYGIKAASKVKNQAIFAIKLADLTSALVSLVLTQTAILSFTETKDTSFFNGVSGMLFGGIAALIGIYMMIRAALIKRKNM